VVALALVAVSLGLAGCPRDASLGTVTFPRGALLHRFSFADCRERTVGRVPAPRAHPAVVSPDGRFTATIRVRGHAQTEVQSIWVTDRRSGRTRRVFATRTWATGMISLGSRGPIVLVGWSGNDRWLFFAVDPQGSGSIAADGLLLRVASASGGKATRVARMLADSDYLTWCGRTLVFTAGEGRVATHDKHLEVAAPPDWRPRALWRDPRRAFGSVACAPDGGSVAVLSQPDRDDGSFFHTRWELWRVGLDGSRTLLDRPPPGTADESPRWSRDGRALLFVRERQGHGSLMLLRNRRVSGPFASLGYSLGFYGHRDWWAAATWSAAAP
jgi:hypothetical protein